MPVTVLLSLAGVSVSAGVEGAGFGPVVGSYHCDTQACAPGCPWEQLPRSDGNNRRLCCLWTGSRSRAPGWGAARALTAQDALFYVQPLSWGSDPPPTLHRPPSALAWPFWASIRGLGWSHRGLDSLRWNPLQVNRG